MTNFSDVGLNISQLSTEVLKEQMDILANNITHLELHKEDTDDPVDLNRFQYEQDNLFDLYRDIMTELINRKEIRRGP